MERIHIGFAATLFGVIAFATSVHADWPQMFGPTQDAVAAAMQIVDRLPADGLKPVWKAKVGPGYGGAAIVGDEVFLMDRVAQESDVLRVFDLKTGKEKWSVKHEAKGHVPYAGGRCTPAVTDDYVFATGCMGDIYAFDRKNQKLLWHFNMLKKYEDYDQRFGYGQNALVHKDTVIFVATSSESPGLIAFDQKTGKTVWESENFGAAKFYCSPVFRTIDGVTAIVIRDLLHVYFIDPDTGKTLWKHQAYPEGRIPIVVPTVLPDGKHVFITNGYGMGSVMLHVERDGDKWQIEEKWRMERGSQIHPPIYFGGHLYINFNENDTLRKAHLREKAGLACVDPKTGKILWNTGTKPSLNRGPIMLVDDKLLAFDADTGELHMAKPNPEKYHSLGSFVALPPKQERNNNAWAPLALTDGLLIVRDHEEMRCYDLSSD